MTPTVRIEPVDGTDAVLRFKLSTFDFLDGVSAKVGASRARCFS